MKVVLAGLSYFGLAFGAGFALGAMRVLFLVPRIGERYAELCEIPVMLVVIYYSARFIVSKFGLDHKSASAFLCGLIALVLLLSFEFTLVLYVRELSFSQYIDTRDLISGSAYVISLVIFWLMPIWLAKGE